MGIIRHKMHSWLNFFFCQLCLLNKLINNCVLKKYSWNFSNTFFPKYISSYIHIQVNGYNDFETPTLCTYCARKTVFKNSFKVFSYMCPTFLRISKMYNFTLNTLTILFLKHNSFNITISYAKSCYWLKQ